jgi:hypothetical protein
MQRCALPTLRESSPQGTPKGTRTAFASSNPVTDQSKWRALAELERRGLIRIEHRSKKSPLISIP